MRSRKGVMDYEKVGSRYDVINESQRKKSHFFTFGVDARWLLNLF